MTDADQVFFEQSGHSIGLAMLAVHALFAGTVILLFKHGASPS